LFHPRGGYQFVGVLTHTFKKLKEEGGNEQSGADKFGKYATINFSSFRDSKNIDGIAQSVGPGQNPPQTEMPPIDPPQITPPNSVENGACMYRDPKTMKQSCTDRSASACPLIQEANRPYTQKWYKDMDCSKALGNAGTGTGQGSQTVGSSGQKYAFGARALDSVPGVGIKITEVMAGSPAEKAGLKVGQVIVAIDDTTLNTEKDYENVIDNAVAARKLSVSVMITGQQNRIVVVLGY
jgi:hypothetical protein